MHFEERLAPRRGRLLAVVEIKPLLVALAGPLEDLEILARELVHAGAVKPG